MQSLKVFCLALLFMIQGNLLWGQKFALEGKYYRTKKGQPIYIPLGKIAFVDRIITFKEGQPKAEEKYRDPLQALGQPNYVHYKVPNFVSLGCGGQLIVEFTDNGFIDLEGPDLYIFEVGPSVESFKLDISTDGKIWKSLGKIDGGKSLVDIAPVAKNSEDIFYFLRLTDLKEICSGKSPGIDIDAIGTISGVLKIELDTDVLFESASYHIKPKGINRLKELAKQIRSVGMAKIIIEGHTDSDGSITFNDNLSLLRAKAVRFMLKRYLDNQGEYLYAIFGYGEHKPISNNDTEGGKALNRRVEVIILPHKDFYKNKQN